MTNCHSPTASIPTARPAIVALFALFGACSCPCSVLVCGLFDRSFWPVRSVWERGSPPTDGGASTRTRRRAPRDLTRRGGVCTDEFGQT